jgi:hypothetical protein
MTKNTKCACGRNKWHKAKRCLVCHNKYLYELNKNKEFIFLKNHKWIKGKKHHSYKNGKVICIDCGKRLKSWGNKVKRCKKCEYKKRKGIKTGNKFAKHHINLNKNDNSKHNILIIKQSKHAQLHHRAYDYLVKINKIHVYLKWFKNKYCRKFDVLKEQI